MNVTVVIPTFNRAETLRKTLEAYAAQTGDHRILEVLVVDDGSTDHTRKVVDESLLSGLPIRYLKQQNRGQAAARNHAIREARGELLLFGDDDIIPSPRLAAEHVHWHDIYPEESCGVLGLVDWWPGVRPTPFMKWSGLYGPQFNYGYFTPGQELGFEYGYSCNWSVGTAFLRKYGIFSENFRTYGYEDVELNYRLTQNGYKLLYNPAAIGYHNKYETVDDTIRRVNSLYNSWPEFARTEAGQHFLQLYRGGKEKSGKRPRGLFKTLFAPIKPLAAHLVKPLFDTHIPLPYWIYEQAFYQHVVSFPEILRNSEQLSHVA
jgi:glycosyltransferase involved in cell wall biosynthesis